MNRQSHAGVLLWRDRALWLPARSTPGRGVHVSHELVELVHLLRRVESRFQLLPIQAKTINQPVQRLRAGRLPAGGAGRAGRGHDPRLLGQQSAIVYDRRDMDVPPHIHPRFPDRDVQGRFIRGHPKLGGRRWTGGPRRLSRKIQRLFQKIENRRIRYATKRAALLRQLQIDLEAYRKPIGPRRASSCQR